jgi:uncharacterized RDD family membrane protein YckC
VPGGDAAEEGRRFVTVQVTSAALAPATVVARLIAYIIDLVILWICGVFILGAIVGDSSIVGGLSRAIIYAVFGFLYFGYTWTAWRASPGQRVLGLMTVNASDGTTLTWNQATRRWVFLFGPSVLNSLFQFSGLSAIVSLLLIGYALYLLYTTATDPQKQGFHDKQASTLVVAKATG